MNSRVFTRLAPIGAAGLAILMMASSGWSQAPSRPAGDGVLHMETKLGSFKIIAVADEPVTGTLTMDFTGSILITGKPSVVKITGNVIKEYDNSNKHYKNPILQKVGYHGTGHLVVTGPLRSIEWFGSNMTGTFVGRAQVRLVGAFDKNLNTGIYWTDADPTKRNWAANNVLTVVVPKVATGGANPTIVPETRAQYEARHHY